MTFEQSKMLEAFGQSGNRSHRKNKHLENFAALWLCTPENNFAPLGLHASENIGFVTLPRCVLCEVKDTQPVKTRF